MPRCVYLNQEHPQNDSDFQCLYFGGLASPHETEKRDVRNCNRCDQKLYLDTETFAHKFQDNLIILDREKMVTTAIRDLLGNRQSAMLVCGGPSTKQLAAEHLNRRGIFSLAVNNMAGDCRFKPSAFVCSDPPKKFHHGIWMDPSIMKFIPMSKLTSKYRGALRRKTVDSKFEGLPFSTIDCPNVWAFRRRGWLQPDETFFTESSATWGNLAEGVERTGLEKSVCTMLLGIRILYYLGARRIFLVGVDFSMTEESGYSFNQSRDHSATVSNNNIYRVVNGWLETMAKVGVFRKFGVEIYNCNQNSSLRAFSYVPFEEAIADCRNGFPEEPFDLSGWYNDKEEQT